MFKDWHDLLCLYEKCKIIIKVNFFFFTEHSKLSHPWKIVRTDFHLLKAMLDKESTFLIFLSIKEVLLTSSKTRTSLMNVESELRVLTFIKIKQQYHHT